MRHQRPRPTSPGGSSAEERAKSPFQETLDAARQHHVEAAERLVALTEAAMAAEREVEVTEREIIQLRRQLALAPR